MAVTKIADVIVPEVFAPYVIERTAEKSLIFKSGMARPNEKLNGLISGGGKTITIPAYKSLTGRSQLLDDTTPMNVNGLKTKADIAAALYRGNAWGANELAAALSGSKPFEAIADLVSDYWVEEEQALLMDILKGTFAAASMANLKAGGVGSYYSGDLLIDAQGKLGDAAGKLTAIAMHSAVRNDLLKKDKTAFRSWREENVQYETYLGYNVIVDDHCPENDGTYTSYLFAEGSVSLGTGQPSEMTLVETDRDSLSGNNVLINRKALVIHPNGMKWKGQPVGATPSDTELGTGGNWERVSDIKNMGIVMVEGKLGAGA